MRENLFWWVGFCPLLIFWPAFDFGIKSLNINKNKVCHYLLYLLVINKGESLVLWIPEQRIYLRQYPLRLKPISRKVSFLNYLCLRKSNLRPSYLVPLMLIAKFRGRLPNLPLRSNLTTYIPNLCFCVIKSLPITVCVILVKKVFVYFTSKKS